jgi:hypothetical protein
LSSLISNFDVFQFEPNGIIETCGRFFLPRFGC